MSSEQKRAERTPQDTTVVNSITERPTSAVSHYSRRCRRLPFIMEEQGKSLVLQDMEDECQSGLVFKNVVS